jgi:hypothetical protein
MKLEELVEGAYFAHSRQVSKISVLLALVAYRLRCTTPSQAPASVSLRRRSSPLTTALCAGSLAGYGAHKSKLAVYAMFQMWGAAYSVLYKDYDIKAELMPRFRENTAKLIDLLPKVESEAKAVFGGLADGA